MILGKLKSYAVAAGAGIIGILLFLLRMRGKKIDRYKEADARAEMTSEMLAEEDDRIMAEDRAEREEIERRFGD